MKKACCFLILLAACLCLPASRAAASAYTTWGYAGAQSVPQGGTIDFHVSSTDATYDLVFFRYGEKLEQVGRVNGLPGAEYACPDSHLGCGWPVAYTLNVPEEWPSGLYLARLLTPGESLNSTWGAWIWFIVRAANPGASSSVLLVVSDNTWQAYNARGGLSFYPDDSIGRGRSNYLSFDRPYGGPSEPEWAPSPAYLELPMIRWLEQNDYVVEYAGNYDLHTIPDLLSHYDTYMDIGHDEYWSWEMRDQVEAFIAAGGNATFFSSNTSYWQVRYEDNGRTLVGYKSDQDPVLYDADPTNDHLVTHLWCGPLVNRCEAAITGVSYINGGRAKSFNCYWCDNGFHAWHVDHWAYAGTGVSYGQVYGDTDQYAGFTGIAAGEVDGALHDGAMYAPGPSVSAAGLAQGTPANFVILATATALNDFGGLGDGTMGVYTNDAGATVFSSSSWDWSDVGLMAGNPIVVRVTRNVFDRVGFLPACLPPDVKIEQITGTNNVKLSWAPHAANDAYEVYRSTQPYFTPSSSTLYTTLTPQIEGSYVKPYSLTDSSKIGDPDVNYFWVVRAKCGAGQADTRPVAEFDFRMQP